MANGLVAFGLPGRFPAERWLDGGQTLQVLTGTGMATKNAKNTKIYGLVGVSGWDYSFFAFFVFLVANGLVTKWTAWLLPGRTLSEHLRTDPATVWEG